MPRHQRPTRTVADPGAAVSTRPRSDPVQVVQWFGFRVEVTFQEVRAHLGVETQRPDRAIARTTPLLLGLFWSKLTLAASYNGSVLPPAQQYPTRRSRPS